MKKIYVDGLGLVDGHFSGVGQYIYGILKGIDEIIDEDRYAGRTFPSVRVIIPYDSVPKFLSFGFKHVGYVKFPLSFRMMSALWHRDKLPPIDLWCGRGAYIFPRFVDMPLAFSKSALVIYDLSFELYRQYSDEGNAKFLSAAVKKSLKKTSKIITISQNAHKEIVNFYGLEDSDVAIATPATDIAELYRRGPDDIARAKIKYGITGGYILALSNLEPRKNLDALVDAYCQLPVKYREDTALVLVGVSGWKTDKLFQKIIGKVEEGYNIIRPSSYVNDDDKPAIISGAKMLVYPSHYEGFGMPPLEALACGVPVITADNSSLPEVVGKVGSMVPSDSTDQLVKALVQTLDNLSSITKKTLLEGPDQALKFSWKRSAKVYLDVAKEL
jgi:glycosyltransferase involved in cell wall biosynthesis